MIFLPLNVSLAAPEGELVMARQRDAQFLDPNVATSDRSVNGLLFGSIVRQNLYDGKYSWNLANSWEVINPTTWKFNLQKGVKFHNGTEVTSADVKFSFDRTMASSIRSSGVIGRERSTN
jgi:peptide/nickel transport system substrate-binding protein